MSPSVNIVKGSQLSWTAHAEIKIKFTYYYLFKDWNSLLLINVLLFHIKKIYIYIIGLYKFKM